MQLMSTLVAVAFHEKAYILYPSPFVVTICIARYLDGKKDQRINIGPDKLKAGNLPLFLYF